VSDECGRLSGVKINLPSFNETAALFRTACVSMGAKVTQSANAAISFFPDGIDIMLTLRDGRVFGRWQLLAYVLSKREEELVMLPEDAPFSAEEYIAARGKKVIRGGKNLLPCVYNAAFAAAALLAESARQKRDLAEIADDFPVFAVRCETVDFPARRKAARTGELCRECGRDTPVFTDKRGTVRVIPDSPRGFRIIAEAASSEFAEELCELAKRRVNDPPNASNR
jgi:hypothetical protein